MLKVYRAKVEGVLKIKERKLSDVLIKKPHYARVATHKDVEGKESVLVYRVLDDNKTSSTLEIELGSGRYHQIRVQMSTRGHPILGDKKYGSTTHYADGHIDLHHVRVEFQHPIHNILVTVTSHY